jgi:WhiB family redox-sensing transcriptional regulator
MVDVLRWIDQQAFDEVANRLDAIDGARAAGVDYDLFFPERGQSDKPAKAICATCPVREECLDYALGTKVEHGIWGGTSENQRRMLRGGDRQKQPA